MSNQCMNPECPREIPPLRAKEKNRITCCKKCAAAWNHLPCKKREEVRGLRYGEVSE